MHPVPGLRLDGAMGYLLCTERQYLSPMERCLPLHPFEELADAVAS